MCQLNLSESQTITVTSGSFQDSNVSLFVLFLIRLKRSVNKVTGSVSDFHAYLGNEDNVNHPFIQTQLLLVTVYQMITLISEDNKRQFDMFVCRK